MDKGAGFLIDNLLSVPKKEQRQFDVFDSSACFSFETLSWENQEFSSPVKTSKSFNITQCRCSCEKLEKDGHFSDPADSCKGPVSTECCPRQAENKTKSSLGNLHCVGRVTDQYTFKDYWDHLNIFSYDWNLRNSYDSRFKERRHCSDIFASQSDQCSLSSCHYNIHRDYGSPRQPLVSRTPENESFDNGKEGDRNTDIRTENCENKESEKLEWITNPRPFYRKG